MPTEMSVVTCKHCRRQWGQTEETEQDRRQAIPNCPYCGKDLAEELASDRVSVFWVYPLKRALPLEQLRFIRPRQDDFEVCHIDPDSGYKRTVFGVPYVCFEIAGKGGETPLVLSLTLAGGGIVVEAHFSKADALDRGGTDADNLH